MLSTGHLDNENTISNNLTNGAPNAAAQQKPAQIAIGAPWDRATAMAHCSKKAKQIQNPR